MQNSLTIELEATINRLKIIADNISDNNIKNIANSCALGVTQMNNEVKQLLEPKKMT